MISNDSLQHLRRRIARVLLLAILIPGTNGCYDAGFGTPDPEQNDEAVTEFLADLRKNFAGSPTVLPDNVTVEGVVTTSDRAENFYRTFCVEQDGAALEVMAGIDQLHNDFPVGCRVTLHLGGLTLSESYGVLQVGNRPEAGSGYEVDYLGSQAALERVVVRRSEHLVDPEPATLTIPRLTPERCGTLVRIEGLRHQPEVSFDTHWSGYRRFVDADGYGIYTYVRSYADFAGGEIPSQSVTLTGTPPPPPPPEGRYLLKLRDEEDCSLY